MSNYDFSTLNDKDFEELSRDLIQKELNITFESFKSGKDKGIDLRYSKPANNENIILQAKHYLKSGLSQLKSKLKSEEVAKAKKLNPSRYIITTSVPLSPQDKDDIKKEFEPYILSTGDIYGQDDLNNLLGKLPDIEKNHHKLWFSSTTILEKILSNAVHGRSEFQRELIIEKTKLFVECSYYDRAREILNNERVLLITGEPGAGKTTLAEFLTWKLMEKGFELIYIDDNLKEAEQLFSNDPEKKQIFYFDDFLGSNYLEVSSEKNFDSKIVNFIKRVKSHKNRVFIMTTRTVILNKARTELEKLDKPEFLASTYEVNVGSYIPKEKAQILYNHIFHSTVSEDLQEIIFENGNYYKIINHKNFNPRLIEFINSSYNVSASTSQEYLDFILNSLNNPEEVWKFVYENQTSEESKFLIMTLFSFPDKTKNEVHLEKAFESRLNYERYKNNYQIHSNSFNSSVKLLLNGFIRRNLIFESLLGQKGFGYEFINPSIVDFLIYYLNNNKDEKMNVIKSSCYVEQLSFRFNYISKTNVFFNDDEIKDIFSWLEKIILEDKLYSIYKGSKEIEIIYFIIKNFPKFKINNIIIYLINNLEIDKLHFGSFFYLETLLNFSSKEKELRSKILDIWEDLIKKLFDLSSDMEDLKFILNVFSLYQIDYNKFIENKNILSNIRKKLTYFWNKNIESYIKDNENLSGTNYEEIRKEVLKLKDEFEIFNSDFGVRLDEFNSHFWDFDIQKKLDENIEAQYPDDDQLYDEWKDSHYPDSGSIDNLFSK